MLVPEREPRDKLTWAPSFSTPQALAHVQAKNAVTMTTMGGQVPAFIE